MGKQRTNQPRRKEKEERRSAADPGSDRCNCGILLCGL